jgi:hypothetical protein
MENLTKDYLEDTSFIATQFLYKNYFKKENFLNKEDFLNKKNKVFNPKTYCFGYNIDLKKISFIAYEYVDKYIVKVENNVVSEFYKLTNQKIEFPINHPNMYYHIISYDINSFLPLEGYVQNNDISEKYDIKTNKLLSVFYTAEYTSLPEEYKKELLNFNYKDIITVYTNKQEGYTDEQKGRYVYCYFNKNLL